METEDAADPRKTYALNKSKCQGLTYLQKIHRADCVREATMPVIIRPKPHPPVPPKPPTPPPAPHLYHQPVS